jgi:hypothetical protein
MSTLYIGFFHQDTGRRILGKISRDDFENFSGPIDQDFLINLIHENSKEMDDPKLMFCVTRVFISENVINDDEDQYILCMKDGDGTIKWSIHHGKKPNDRTPVDVFQDHCLKYIYEHPTEEQLETSEV